MHKFLSFMLLFLFINGTFVSIFSSVSTQELIEDTWNTKASMNQARRDLGVITVEGKIYAIGGRTNNDRFVNTNERYDPVTDTWVTLTAMPTRRSNFAIAAYEDKIYCIGGETSDENGKWSPCDITEVYDTTTDSWAIKKNLPTNEWKLQASTLDGKIFVATYSHLYMYDPLQDSWTKKASMFDMFHMGELFISSSDNKLVAIHVTPHLDLQETHSEVKVMIYNTKSNKWSERSKLPIESYPSQNYFTGAAGATGTTTERYTSQGIYLLTPINSAVYNLKNNTWTTATNMLTPRTNFGVAVVDDVLYVIGGYAYTSSNNIGSMELLAINEQYVPAGYYSTLTEETLPTEEDDALFENLNMMSMVTAVLIGSIVTVGIILLYKKNDKNKSTNMIRKA